MARVRVPVDNQKKPKNTKPKSVNSAPLAEPIPPTTESVEAGGGTSSWISRNKQALIVIGFALVIIILLLTLLNDRNRLNRQLSELESQKTSSQTGSGNAEAEQLTSEIGKYLQLPSDEQPNVATVEDVEKVRSQTFFKNAANGDKVLLYAKSGKVILYRPSEKKVIEVALVNQNATNPLQPNAQNQ